MLLHAQIAANKRKTWVLVAVFLAFFGLVGAAAGIVIADEPRLGIILALLIGAIYTAMMLTLGTGIIMRMNRAREVASEDDNPFLWNTVESLAIAARLPMPRVFIIDDPSPNAFATGMSPNKAAVAVTTGLLDRLSRQEVEAVLAHEVAHIRNYDVRLATAVIALVSAVAVLVDLALRVVWMGGRSQGRSRGRSETKDSPHVYLAALLLLLVSHLVATLIQLAISRNREYLADASGAELCRNPAALASALRKIAEVEEPVRAASPASASLYFSDPIKKRRRAWFSTHPPVEERIRRLEQMM